MIKEHILMAGPVAWVLIGLSTIALTLLLERLWVHFRYPMSVNKQALNEYKLLLQSNNVSAASNLLKQESRQRSHGMSAAIGGFLSTTHLNAVQREQAASLWLQAEREYLNSHLNFVGLIGSLAPLLGLLGTVFGIITMFMSIAHSTDPVTPALLADGMWTAMVTTALGLLIAIPSLAASSGLELLSRQRIFQIQTLLNELNQALLGETTDLELIEEQDETVSLHIAGTA